jgi:hypothetical protein
LDDVEKFLVLTSTRFRGRRRLAGQWEIALGDLRAL